MKPRNRFTSCFLFAFSAIGGGCTYDEEAQDVGIEGSAQEPEATATDDSDSIEEALAAPTCAAAAQQSHLWKGLSCESAETFIRGHASTQSQYDFGAKYRSACVASRNVALSKCTTGLAVVHRWRLSSNMHWVGMRSGSFKPTVLRRTTSQSPEGFGADYLEASFAFAANAQPGGWQVYECEGGGGKYLSRSPTCSGGAQSSLRAYSFKSGTPGTTAIRQCRRQDGDRFLTRALNCEGHTLEAIIGYAK